MVKIKPARETRDIAERFTIHECRLKRIEAGLRAVQLGNSSLQGTGLNMFDANGNYRGTIGFQEDGTTALVSANPLPPPVPGAPIVTPGLAHLLVRHNGETADGTGNPADLSHLNVYTADVGLPEVRTIRATISPLPGETVITLPDYAQVLVTVTAVNLGGRESAHSAPSSGTPLQAVSADLVNGIIQAVHLNSGIVGEAVLAANAVTSTKIADDAVTSPKIIAGAVVAGKLAVDSVNAGNIIAGSVTTEKLNALAVTADKMAANSVTAGKIEAGAVTAAKLEANMVIANRIIAGSATGNRVEIHPTLGLQGFSNSGALRTFWIDAATGSVTAIGTWRTGTSGERIEILTDGTLNFYNSSNSLSAKVENDNGLVIRGPGSSSTSVTGRVFIVGGGAYLTYGNNASNRPATFAVENVGTQQWGRLVGMRYMAGYSGDGTAPRVFMVGVDTAGNDASTIHVWRRSFDGFSYMSSPNSDSGVAFVSEPGIGAEVYIVNYGGNAFRPVRASGFPVGSSETMKVGINEVTIPQDRSSWDVIEGAPALEWYYTDEEPAENVPTDGYGNIAQLRKRNPALTDEQWESMRDEHPDKWIWEDHPPVSTGSRWIRHRFPIAEDLRAIDPDLVRDGANGPNDLAVDLRDIVGIHHNAIDLLIKRLRIIEGELDKIPQVNLPPRPQKGDLVAGIGDKVPGRTKREIDTVTGQAKKKGPTPNG